MKTATKCTRFCERCGEPATGFTTDGADTWRCDEHGGWVSEWDAAIDAAVRVAQSYVVAGTDRDKYANGNASGIADEIRALRRAP